MIRKVLLLGTHKATIIVYFITPSIGTGVVNTINTLETKNNLGYIEGISLYRAVNTLRPCYKNRLNVVYGNNYCLFCDHTKHINSLCGQNVELSDVYLVVHISNTKVQKGDVLSTVLDYLYTMPTIPVVARSKAWVCGR